MWLSPMSLSEVRALEQAYSEYREATKKGGVLLRVNGVPPLYREGVALDTGARFPS